MAAWSWRQTVFVLVVAPVALWLFARYASPSLAWLIALLLLVVTIGLIGWAIKGVGRGIFVDERNKVSLSRFQTVLWTVVVLSGFLVMVGQNVRKGTADPALITFPSELLWLIGISATSLVGSPLIRTIQEAKHPDPTDVPPTIVELDRIGVIGVNTHPAISSWADMFMGEEITNGAYVDLGKVQMFFFTLIAVGVYAMLLGKAIAAGAPFNEFPDLTEGLVGLLAISHASYLANKAVTRTPTT